jgi:hypothetical protein
MFPGSNQTTQIHTWTQNSSKPNVHPESTIAANPATNPMEQSGAMEKNVLIGNNTAQSNQKKRKQKKGPW